MRKRVAHTLASLLVLALSSACGRSPQAGTIELRFRFWAGTTEGAAAMAKLVERFEGSHPGVKIRAERKPSGGSYQDVLLAEFAAGTAPDVIYLSTDNSDELIATGRLASLQPYLDADPSLKASDFYAPLLRRFSVKGQVFVLPRDVSPIAVVYYNKALFDRAGLAYPADDWTWDDLRRLARRLTRRAADGRAEVLGFGDDWNLMEAWVLAGGGGLVDDEAHPRRITLDEPAAMKGILYRWSLQQVDRVMPQAGDTQTLQAGTTELFLGQKLAMFHTGLWKIGAFRQIKDFDWDAVRFPRAPGQRRPRYFGGGSGYAMHAGTKHPQLAWDFLKFMGGPEGQQALAADIGLLPALKALASSPAFLDGQKPARKKSLLVLADHPGFLPAWRRWREFRQGVWGPLTDPMWAPGYEGRPEAMVKEAVERGNKLFKDGVQ